MDSMKVLLSAVFLLGLINWPLASGREYWFEDDLHLDGNCEYKGYIPGGGVPNIKPITAPVAKLPGSALAEIAGVGEKGTKIAETALKIGEAFAKAGSTFAAAAPGIGAALAVFGAGVGFLSDELKPKPEDILKAVNKAIKELTTAINDRLQKMIGYVDASIINLKKNLVDQEYTTLFESFTGCIEGPALTKKNVDECVRNVEKKIKASRGKFMPSKKFLEQWNPKSKNHYRYYFGKNPSKAPSYKLVKEMEAVLLTFRDFANLHLLVLSSLINTFKKSGPKGHLDYYVKRKKFYAQQYARYANWAMDWAFLRNVYENEDNTHDHQYLFKCEKMEHVKEGVSGFKRHTVDALRCSMDCTGMSSQTRGQCKYKVELRADGKTPDGYVSVNYNDLPSFKWDYAIAAKRYARHQGAKMCSKYNNLLLKDMKTYYGSVIDENVKVWKKMANKQGA